MIDVKNLFFEYPDKQALKDVTLSIPKGRITAFVGPNGAGKTTLLQIISAILPPLSGSVKVDNIDVTKDPRSVHKIVGFLPDFFGLYPNLTVYKSLIYYGSMYQVPQNEIDEKINNILKLFSLEDKKHIELKKLSRGMKQKVGIAQTILHTPKILMLDEPASGLDPEARYDLGKLFKKLNSEGITLVISSHILSELDQYANNLVMIKDGQIVDTDINLSQKDEVIEIICKIVDDDYTTIKKILKVDHFVNKYTQEEKTFKISFSGDQEQQHKLLNRLITSGVKVSSFSSQKQQIQDKYLELVRGDK